MLTLRRIVRDYADAGSLNSLLALWGFITDDTFLTKTGAVGLVYRLAGVDFECLDQAQRRDVVHRFEAALRLLDESCRVYQYLCKRAIAPLRAASCRHALAHEAMQRRVAFLNTRSSTLYQVELYLVLIYEGAEMRDAASEHLRQFARAPRETLRTWLSPQRTWAVLDTALDRAVTHLHQQATALEVQLADTVRPHRLLKADSFQFFRGLLNPSPAIAAAAHLAYDTHLDYFVADSAVACHRDHLEVGSRRVKVLSMKEPPAATFPQVLEALYTLPGEFIACLEWRRLANDHMRRELQQRRRHFFNRRVSIINYVSPDTRPEEMLVDESAGATVRQLGNALTEMEVHGHFFGECSLTLVLIGDESRALDRTAAEAIKALATHDGAFIDETYNLLNAWLSVIPGNSAHNLRRLALLETNLADLSFLFTLDAGTPRCPHLDAPALAALETRHETPYHFALHVGDVGHTLILGSTGSGKSFLLNFLTLHAQAYDPLTVIFDLGHSYQKLATLLDGSYLELGLRCRDVHINPFALDPTPEHLHFLHAFVRVLVEGSDAYRLSDAEDREIYEAVENLYVLDRTQRRLFTLANLLPRTLAARLSRWIEGGRYAELFDHVEDTFDVRPFQVFDFEAMRAYPSLLEPLLFYVLHRVGTRISDPDAPGLKVCVMDEAWRFIQHPTLRAYVEESLKTWRKRNAVLLLATQAADDFASADLLRTVIEGCPTTLFLANPAFDRRVYSDLFHLNETECDLLASLMPKRQFLLKRPDVAKVLTLTVDPRSYWLYTNTPLDNAKVAAVFREHGFAAGLDVLATSA